MNCDWDGLLFAAALVFGLGYFFTTPFTFEKSYGEHNNANQSVPVRRDFYAQFDTD